MRRRSIAVGTPGLALILASLLGCGAGTTATPAPSGIVTLLDRQGWPGGQVRLASEDFRVWGDEVALQLGATTLATTRLDETTVAATLPADTPALDVAPVAQYAGTSVTLPLLAVAGFASAQDLPNDAHIAWDAYATTIDGVGYAIGGNLTGDLAMIRLSDGAVQTVPGALDGNRLRGPGVTYQLGIWVLRSAGGLEDWRLDSPLAKLAEHPEFAPPSTRQAAHLSADVWLTTTSQTWSMWTRANAGASYALGPTGSGFDDPQGVLLSPRGDRAVVRVDRVLAGVPIFDAVSGTTAFVTDLTSVLGASFSATGASIALVGGTHGGLPGTSSTPDPSRLEVVRATDGQVLLQRELEGEAFAVAHVPGTNWLLVGVSSGDNGAWRPRLMVLDGADLHIVATLEAPAATPTCGTIGNCFGAVLGVDGTTATVFWSWNGPPHLWRFRLQAPPQD